MKTLKVVSLALAAVLCAPALAQKAALVRNIDRLGNSGSTVIACDANASQQCTWSIPGTSPGSVRFVTVFLSYKIRFNAATTVTAVGFYCGPSGIDWLPTPQPNGPDDSGHREISWAGLVTRLFDPACSGGAIYNGSGPQAEHLEMRVHGFFPDNTP
ncbi:hypothetical protein [Massilia endophytica]|uniref:hypothetical protein n=1 Tax=Massilia endophytica TaxID=2899220 RepID=UPI001E3C9A10|nr:hypothetical protein [Massilia endophytica]UGQ44655.1 hypothetical protein LSQ66_12660 [Massilia endophytica]